MASQVWGEQGWSDLLLPHPSVSPEAHESAHSARPLTSCAYRYSTPRVDFIGISCYSSVDLLAWQNEGKLHISVLPQVQSASAAYNMRPASAGLALQAGAHPELHPSRVAERPRVLYNNRTQTFVMWLHVDEADYELARVGLAVAKAPQVIDDGNAQ